jgi:hypothetical protein
MNRISFFHTVDAEPELRPRNRMSSSSSSARQHATTKFNLQDPIAVLKAGLRTVRHHKLGWLKEDMLNNGTIDGTKESLYAKLFADYQTQQIYIRAQKDILGDDFNPLLSMPGRDEERRFSFTKNEKR